MILVCRLIEDLKIIEGGAVSYSPPPTSEPSTTGRTGRVEKNFKHRDSGQENRGIMVSAGSQLEGYFRREDGG